jgi:hypothetical protein
MTIHLMIKNVYGNELVYPVCSHAKYLASFKGTKTFNDQDLTKLKQMGYSFQWAALKREI